MSDYGCKFFVIVKDFINLEWAESGYSIVSKHKSLGAAFKASLKIKLPEGYSGNWDYSTILIHEDDNYVRIDDSKNAQHMLEIARLEMGE